jgi:hypothetical protein
MALILKYVCSNFFEASSPVYTYTELRQVFPLFKSEA